MDPKEIQATGEIAAGNKPILPSSANSPTEAIGTGWAPLAPEAFSKLLPQFEIEELIGRGGMGAVYRALQPSLERIVAIKLLPSELAADPLFVARFRREARTLAKLQHPGIVAIFDVGQTDSGHLYSVMEFIDGIDLQRTLHGPGLAPGLVLPLVVQICDALHYAHSCGVVHRDIKPANILLTRSGKAKLIDFGLARPLSSDTVPPLTRTGGILGTPEYLAPEALCGEPDHRADIYSLGITLYEMLTGRPPRGAWPPPSQRSPVDPRLDEIVNRALQEDPSLRYQSALEIKTDLEHIIGSDDRTAPTRPAAEARASEEGGAGAGRHADSEPLPDACRDTKNSRRSRRFVAGPSMAWGGAATAVFLLAGFWLWPRTSQDRPPTKDGHLVPKGWDGDLVAAEIQPNRIQRVRLGDGQSHPVYDRIRFEQIDEKDPPRSRRLATEYEYRLEQESIALEKGTYRVTLLGREGLETSRGPVRVDPRVLHEGLEIVADPAQPASVEIPAWPLPTLAAGLERTETAPLQTVSFGISPTAPEFGKVSRGWRIPVERAMLLDLGESLLEGHLYGEHFSTYDHNPIETVAGYLSKELLNAGKPLANVATYLARFEEASGGVIKGVEDPAKEARTRRDERLLALKGLGAHFEAFYLGESLANPLEQKATTKFRDELKAHNEEKEYQYWCQAVWLKSLAPTTGSRPREFAGIADRTLSFLEQVRGNAIRELRLPTAQQHQALRESWESLLQVAYGTRSSIGRNDLERLKANFTAGEFEAAILVASEVHVSWVDREGKVFFGINYQIGAPIDPIPYRDVQLEITVGGVIRLLLPSLGRDGMELRPVDWSD